MWTGATVTAEEIDKDAKFLILARDVLAHRVNLIGNQNIKRFADTVVTGKPPLGFTIQETKYPHI